MTTVVRRATRDEGFEVDDWSCEPLAYTELNPVSGGLWIVRGTRYRGEAEWSVVLKVLRHPRGGRLPTGRPVTDGWGEEPSHYNYWRREPLAFSSGALENLDGIGAPRHFAIEDGSSEEARLWLEHVDGALGEDWTVDDYGLVARRLGRFNGAYVAGRPVPSGAWVGRRVAAGWTEEWAAAVEELSTSRGSTLARLCPPDLRDRLLRLWAERGALYDGLERLPQSFCHLDAFPSNLLICPDDERDVVAVDWALCGTAAPGEELVQLVVPSMVLLGKDVGEAREIQDVAVEAYIEGLGDAGAQVDPSQVFAAYAVAAALRWAFPPLEVFGKAGEEEAVRRLVEETSNRPFEEAVEHHRDILYFLLELADEGCDGIG